MFGDADFVWLDRLRREHYPANRNHVPAHLTLFHQLPPSSEPELGSRLAAHCKRPAPHAKLAGGMDLGGGTAFRVESAELEAIRADLAEALFGLLIPQDAGNWRPHVTIQNKVSPREARKLQEQLRNSFTPRPLRIVGLASWRYLGGPWQRIREWSFRG